MYNIGWYFVLIEPEGKIFRVFGYWVAVRAEKN